MLDHTHNYSTIAVLHLLQNKHQTQTPTYLRQRGRYAKQHKRHHQRNINRVFVILQRIRTKQRDIPGKKAVPGHTQTVLELDCRCYQQGQQAVQCRQTYPYEETHYEGVAELRGRVAAVPGDLHRHQQGLWKG